MALPFAGILLAMQAAGTIVNLSSQRRSQKYIELGRTLEQAAIENNLDAIRLESTQSSLEEMQQLRKNIGSQIALNAARGTRSGAGSAGIATQQSIRTFNQDERKRRLNLLSREADLRASNVLSGLHTLQSETRLGQKVTSDLLNNTLLSGKFQTQVNKFRKTDFAKKVGFGLETANQ